MGPARHPAQGLAIREKVRLVKIDCPDQDQRPPGPQGTARLAELVLGRPVALEVALQSRARYGRLLAALERERRLDPERFARKYEADSRRIRRSSFRAPGSTPRSRPARHELPPQEGVRYVAAVDPSGGGQDSFTLAIAHTQGRAPERRIVQLLQEGDGALEPLTPGRGYPRR